MKFEMDINVLQIRGGNSVNTKSIGTWTAGLDSPLVVKDEDIMKNLTADTVYRIFTVVVGYPSFIIFVSFALTLFKSINQLIQCNIRTIYITNSKLHSLLRMRRPQRVIKAIVLI